MTNRAISTMQINERTLRFDFETKSFNESFTAIQAFCDFVELEWKGLLEEVVPSYQTISVYFQRDLINSAALIEEIQLKWQSRPIRKVHLKSRHIQIPVCYEAPFSEDLLDVVNHTQLSCEEVISLHTSSSYTVFAIGFLPGFPYLGGLSPALEIPRRREPRLVVPKGAVGIGGSQTGIYPIESPGGWNLIGRTPFDLFNANRPQPFLLQAGDTLTFRQISTQQFYEIQLEITVNPKLYLNYVKEVNV